MYILQRSDDLLTLLLPSTLFGALPDQSVNDLDDSLRQALITLQLSCQYASHCVLKLRHYARYVTDFIPCFIVTSPDEPVNYTIENYRCMRNYKKDDGASVNIINISRIL